MADIEKIIGMMGTLVSFHLMHSAFDCIHHLYEKYGTYQDAIDLVLSINSDHIYRCVEDYLEEQCYSVHSIKTVIYFLRDRGFQRNKEMDDFLINIWISGFEGMELVEVVE